jgi:hypothetical protein
MARIHVIVLALFIGLGTTMAHAGPLLPCLTATLSAQGHILVLNDLTYDDPDETHGRRPVTSTFRVLRRYVDLNEGLRLNGPSSYWADALWKVVLTNDRRSPFSACSYTLVTEDGEYLILVGGEIGGQALTIYRRRDHPGQPFGGPGPDHGVLIKQISWSQLFPSETAPVMFTDETPQWYAGGHFVFSPDNQKLIYTTPNGKILHVSLSTGEITRK